MHDFPVPNGLRYDVSVLHDVQQMVGPALQGGSFLRTVVGVIVRACHASAVPAYVVQDGFNNVGLNAELMHLGRYGMPQVVEQPPFDWSSQAFRNSLVERRLGS